MSEKSIIWQRHPRWTVAILIGALLLPFASKAFHVDDPLFLWTGRQILAAPFDFYGFTLNWYGYEKPASVIIKNPPLAGYLIAAVAALFGWQEAPMHIAFLLPAILTGIGIHRVAERMTRQPLLASLVAVTSPVFLVSASTVMSDVLMVLFYVWAVSLWVQGVAENRTGLLLGASLLSAMAVCAKYFGLTLLPLLLAYTLASGKRPRWALPALLLPLLFLLSYETMTHLLYGKGLLSEAGAYAIRHNTADKSGVAAGVVTTLSFTGGCLIGTLGFAPWLWSRRTLLAAGAAAFFGFVLLMGVQNAWGPQFGMKTALRWDHLFLVALFCVAGVQILALAATDFYRTRKADSLLLLLWVLGTFLFAMIVNWTVSGRTILPLAPAAGILLARRLDRRISGTVHAGTQRSFGAVLALGLMVSLSVLWADWSYAENQKNAAVSINRLYRGYPGKIFFQGHWGFQYYMERVGAQPMKFDGTALDPGDLVIVPESNTNISEMPEEGNRMLGTLQEPGTLWVWTMNRKLGSGFYTSRWGPLPFAFGAAPRDGLRIYVMTGQ